MRLGLRKRERERGTAVFGHMACDPSSLLVYLEIDRCKGKERRKERECVCVLN